MLMQSFEPRATVDAGNILLGRLGRTDRTLIDPHLEKIAMRRGAIVIRPDDRLDAIYFIQSGTISIEEPIGRRLHIEIAVVGREGLLGWPSLLGCERSDHMAVVQGCDGSALRIGLREFLGACRNSPTLWMTLLSYLQTIIFQMGRAIASHIDHSLDQNLARWLLMRHDRVGGDELLVRHEEIAEALGVRRASITDKMHVLEGERLIRCNRGRIVVRNRRGLEIMAGEAYGKAEAHYQTLIAPFGKSTHTSAPVIKATLDAEYLSTRNF